MAGIDSIASPCLPIHPLEHILGHGTPCFTRIPSSHGNTRVICGQIARLSYGLPRHAGACRHGAGLHTVGDTA